jgi:hypothetical protein
MHSRTKLLEFIELAKAKGYPLNNAIKIKDLFRSFGEDLKIWLMNGLSGPHQICNLSHCEGSVNCVF